MIDYFDYDLDNDVDRKNHIIKNMLYMVELQADNGGVYIKSSEKSHKEGSRNITEDMSIANKELAIVVAKRILELYGV